MTDQERETVADAVCEAVLQSALLRQRLDQHALLSAANLIRRDVARRLHSEQPPDHAA